MYGIAVVLYPPLPPFSSPSPSLIQLRSAPQSSVIVEIVLLLMLMSRCCLLLRYFCLHDYVNALAMGSTLRQHGVRMSHQTIMTAGAMR